MCILASRWFAVCVLAATEMVSGCAGSAVVQAAAPMNAGVSANRAERSSWISPATSGSDLVYASAGNVVYVYTYPGGSQVGTLTGFNDAAGVCSDVNGNVWVVNSYYYSGSTTLIEYAHGGSKPINTLVDTNNAGDACAVDPSTGNLAAANLTYSVAVWTAAQGNPTFYSTVGLIEDNRTITYDGSGDLYVRSFRAGGARAWLPKGGSSFMQSELKKVGSYGWDGKYFLINGEGKHRTQAVTQYELSGAKGMSVGQVTYNCAGDIPPPGYGPPFAVNGSALVVWCHGGISYFNYPAGGNPIATIPGSYATGLAISVGTSHVHARK